MEQDVLTSLGARGASPAEIAASVGVSEPAVCSVIAMLVEEGKIRITRVEAI
jgi:DNA-binding Lrp family transcriptional regulator